MTTRHIKAGDEIRTINGYITIKDCNESGLVWVDEVIAGLDDDGNETKEKQENQRYTLNEISRIIHDTENVWYKVVYDYHRDHTEEELQPVIDSYIGANTAMSEEQWHDWISKESERYGEDLTDTDKEYIVGKLKEAYLVYRDWYAVLKDREDADWGYGSYDIDEAFEMAKELGGEAYIAVIRERKGYAAECVEELEVELEDNRLNNEAVKAMRQMLEGIEETRKRVNNSIDFYKARLCREFAVSPCDVSVEWLLDEAERIRVYTRELNEDLKRLKTYDDMRDRFKACLPETIEAQEELHKAIAKACDMSRDPLEEEER